MSAPFRDDRADATFSDDRTYRYRLRRTWDAGGDTVAFIMLNPSTADEFDDDPTIRRCIQYGKDWGFGTLLVGNLFAYRASDPSELWGRTGTVGPENDDHLRAIGREADRVVAAWGADGSKMGRGREVAGLLRDGVGVDHYALGTTYAGHPVYPLYQPADLKPEPFTYDGAVSTGWSA